MAKFVDELKVKMKTDEQGFLKFAGKISAETGTLIDISISGLGSCSQAYGVVRRADGTWHSEIYLDASRGGQFSRLFQFVGCSLQSANITLSVQENDGSGGTVEISSNDWSSDTSVFVHGGCVSRDTFELEGAMPLAGYSARSSLVAAFDANVPTVDHSLLEANPSAFQRRMVAAELDRNLPAQLQRRGFDLFLIDFIVERTALVRVGDSILTRSPEFIKCGLDEVVDGVVDNTSDDYFERFEAAWRKVCENVGADNIVVNKVYWARKKTDGGSVRFPSHSDLQNQRLDRLYNLVSRLTPQVNWLVYSSELLVADINHQWGPAPYHFSQDFYHTQNMMLNLIGKHRKSIGASVNGRAPKGTFNESYYQSSKDISINRASLIEFATPLRSFTVEILAEIGEGAEPRNLLMDLEYRASGDQVPLFGSPTVSGFQESPREDIGLFTYIPTISGNIVWRKEISLPNGYECTGVHFRKWGRIQTDVVLRKVIVTHPSGGK